MADWETQEAGQAILDPAQILPPIKLNPQKIPQLAKWLPKQSLNIQNVSDWDASNSTHNGHSDNQQCRRDKNTHGMLGSLLPAFKRAHVKYY